MKLFWSRLALKVVVCVNVKDPKGGYADPGDGHPVAKGAVGGVGGLGQGYLNLILVHKPTPGDYPDQLQRVVRLCPVLIGTGILPDDLNEVIVIHKLLAVGVCRRKFRWVCGGGLGAQGRLGVGPRLLAQFL